MLGAVRSHPWISLSMAMCTIIGAVLGLLFLGDHLSPARRIVGGVIGGLGTGMLIFATRMMGAFDDDDE